MYTNSYLCSSIRDYQKLNVELRQAKSESLQQINERKTLDPLGNNICVG